MSKNQTKEYHRAYRRAYQIGLRKGAQAALGGVCNMCGESDFRVLQIDHIMPKKKQIPSARVFVDIIRGDTSNVQLLCANCHARKTYDNAEYTPSRSDVVSATTT